MDSSYLVTRSFYVSLLPFLRLSIFSRSFGSLIDTEVAEVAAEDSAEENENELTWLFIIWSNRLKLREGIEEKLRTIISTWV